MKKQNPKTEEKIAIGSNEDSIDTKMKEVHIDSNVETFGSYHLFYNYFIFI